MGSPDVGIVIVNYNTQALLQRCLDSVFASEGVTLQVCVVDNHSHDGSAEMVSTEFPQVHLIANARNLGYPAANNQGLRWFGFDGVADTDLAVEGVRRDTRDVPRYALLLNSDTELPATALSAMIKFLDERPEVGAAGPKLVRPDGSLDRACRRSFPTPEVSLYRFAGLSALFPRSRRFGQYNLTYLDEDETTEVDSVVGAFMLVRREAVADAGLMDESFFMYGEDLDWAYRIKNAGWRIFYYPEVTVLHVKRASSRQNPRSRVEFWRSMEIFYRKHYAAQTPWLFHIMILAVVRFQVRVLQWLTTRQP